MINIQETINKYNYTPSQLKPASHKKILYNCDYCGALTEITYDKYNQKLKSTTNKDACKKCKTLKQHESIKSIPNKMEEISQKRQSTNIEKYGNGCPANNTEIQNKIQNNNLQKYGEKHAVQSKIVREKINQTIKKKYGVNNVFSIKEIREKSTQTMIEKYGKAHAIKFGKTEKQLIDEINTKFSTNFQPNHTLISPKHLDAYDDTHKIAIEYCGLYWHNEDSPTPRNKDYHKSKYDECLSKGVRLFTIWEDEWKNNKNGFINLLSSALQKNKKIYARKTEVKQINHQDTVDFYKNNHIQGAIKSTVLNVGLFYDKKLIAAMTFSRHHRNIKQYNESVVLSRMAFDTGTTVVGGAEKMLTFAKQLLKNNYKKIISWSDNRYSQGNVYKKLGFVLEEELKPDYCYIDQKHPTYRISKQKCKKSAIGCEANKTEHQKAKELGLSRLWDCGKKRWCINIQ